MSCSLDNSKMAPVPLDNIVNTGFYYMKSTARSIKAIKYWQEARTRFPPSIDQVVFNNIKHELVTELGAKILPLKTEFVSGFCDFYENGLDKVCTIHANCCLGLENKVHDLKNIAADWKNYTSLTPEKRKKWSVRLTAPNMGLGVAAKEGSTSHIVSFLLGAALPTAVLFFLASHRLGEGLPGISSRWGNGTILPPVGRPAVEATSLTSDVVSAAPAQDQKAEFAGLAELLPKVAIDDKTVIFTSVNEVWTRPNSLLDIFLDDFRNGEDTAHLLNHVLIVAVDSGGFEGCKAVHPHCYLLEIKSMNMSRAKWFGSKEYMELVWLKLSLQFPLHGKMIDTLN
ncbi:hypothetical protein PR202_ga08476 [Eleusine coracana subsp. coracana]|uniref:Nucleotide-diphospho-sugar transferase domain-containing protein n=1 Tax=Eleusine coracana subsp. coracana TaxID=191504 RepID=A0AAV5C3D3_ELECO|nr:hypothetical protein PR202_ga08476 [Eleusine coracana subsp. coracana]